MLQQVPPEESGQTLGRQRYHPLLSVARYSVMAGSIELSGRTFGVASSHIWLFIDGIPSDLSSLINRTWEFWVMSGNVKGMSQGLPYINLLLTF
jgi:hypothetical protein